MKALIGMAAFAILGGMPCVPASARDGQDWYVASGVSMSLLEESHTLVVGKPVPPGYAQQLNAFDAGPGVQLAVGHRLGDARLEVEAGYARNNSDYYIAISPACCRVPAQGGHKALRLMVNGYYDFGSGPFRPHVGAGAGYVDLKAVLFSARTPFPKEAPLLIVDDHKGEFAYQAMAGAGYEIAPGLTVTAQYRYFSAGKVHFVDLSNTEHVRDHRGHNFDFGVRVAF